MQTLTRHDRLKVRVFAQRAPVGLAETAAPAAGAFALVAFGRFGTAEALSSCGIPAGALPRCSPGCGERAGLCGSLGHDEPLLLSACSSADRKAPRGERLSTGCRSWPWHLGPDLVGCLWFNDALSCSWQERKEITSGRRDARGLTFSVVIPARVMQPGISAGGTQMWHMARGGYGMAFALRHLDDCTFQSHLRCAHRLG